jgi:hypothetical protein
MTERLTMTRGDSGEFDLTIVRDGAPIDISTGLLIFTAKYRAADPDEDAPIQKRSDGATPGVVITDGPNGLALITIDPADTEAIAVPNLLTADVQLVETNGRITTVWRGLLAVAPDVTRVAA